MTIDIAISKFYEFYAKALRNKFIHKPISKALYETWKWVDSEEEPRQESEESNENQKM